MTDAAILQYTQVASLARPRDEERDILHTWIASSALGGGCGFLGRDLGGFTQPSVYAEVYKRDLIMLNANHGENDAFTKFLLGPLLTVFHWFWRHIKVRSALSSFQFSDIDQLW